MYFKQFYLGCLAHASYLVGSGGEAAVVDPQRDVDQYVAEAEAVGLRIRYVIETHLHADFVSGHRELAARTGATIIFGHRARATFPHRAVQDGDEIQIGNATLRIMETPGHTPESISILVTDTEDTNEPQKILTGDTLFIGDVGRPDLVGAKGFTAQEMAGMLYDSLHEKLLKLGDEVEVYPAHGAGSMCGRNISRETSSTIGEQKRFNYALQQMPKDEFVRLMTTDLPEAPAYFPRDAEINRAGAVALVDLPKPRALTPEEVRSLCESGHLVLDVRGSADFGAGHVPGALNIGLGGQFASWAGTLIGMSTPLIIVADSQSEAEEAVYAWRASAWKASKVFWTAACMRGMPRALTPRASSRFQWTSSRAVFRNRASCAYSTCGVPSNTRAATSPAQRAFSFRTWNNTSGILTRSARRPSSARAAIAQARPQASSRAKDSTSSTTSSAAHKAGSRQAFP